MVIGVIGSGVMGRSLASYLESHGHHVRKCGRGGDYRTLKDCELVIEAVIEDFTAKMQVLDRIEDMVSPECVVVSNTSSLDVQELGDYRLHPERFCGLHFFNPPKRMQLVEVAPTTQTSPVALATLLVLLTDIQRIPVVVKPLPGYIVNRLLMPFINEAVAALEDGVASARDIDVAVKLGLGHTMGPLATADLIGIDVVLEIMRNLSMQPRPTLVEMYEAGRLGRKTGSGFFDY